MAFPINNPATAVDMGTLPYDIADTFGGVPFGSTWFKWTCPAGVYMIGMHLEASTNPNSSAIEIFETIALTPIIPDFCNPDEPVQIPVTAGLTYYFNLTGTLAGTDTLTISVRSQPTDTPPAGAIIVFDPSDENPLPFPATVLTFADAEVINVVPFAGSAYADILPSGIICVNNIQQGGNNSGVKLFSSTPLGGLIATVANPFTTFDLVVQSDMVDGFWLGKKSTRQIRRVNQSGTLDATTYTLTGAASLNSFAVNPGGTIAYYCEAGVGNVIKAWDITNNLALPDFVAALAGYQAVTLRVLADGSVVIGYMLDADQSIRFRIYTSAGVLTATKDIATGFWVALIARNNDDPTHLVVKVENLALTTSTFYKLLASDLSTVSSFGPIDNFDDGFGHNDTAQYFGPSEEEFVILRSSPEPLSGIYEMVPNRRNDELYLTYSPVTTVEVEIP